MNYEKESIKLHKKHGGKLEISSRVRVRNKKELSLAYSPGIAGPCLEIKKDKKKYKTLVSAGKTVAVISNGTAVLGLGNIGAPASMPVMEGKCVLIREFAGLNAIPIVIDTEDVDEFVATVEQIAGSFGAINLEDISAPKCFEIEDRLKKSLSIPVMHDDQHGTAIVVLAGLINSLKVTKRKISDVRVVINGAGAAGVAITKILAKYGVKHMVVCDSRGIISKTRTDLNPVKKELLKISNKKHVSGSLIDALNGADVFIGVSQADLLREKEITVMNEKPIVFGLANPNPEVDPKKAASYGVEILATGRSDYRNQVNNSLVFPGIFKGALQSGATKITEEMKIAAAEALAKMIKRPTKNKIIPGPFESGICDIVAKAVAKHAKK